MEKLERLRELSREELMQKIGEHKEEIFNLRLSRSSKELDNPIRLRALRRQLARIKTILREDGLGVSKLELPCGNWSSAPHVKLDELVQSAKDKTLALSAKAREQFNEAMIKAKDARAKAATVLKSVKAGKAQDPDLDKAIRQAKQAKKNLGKYLKS